MVRELTLKTQTARQDKLLSFTLAYMVSFMALLNSVNSILNFMGLNTGLDTAVLYISLVICVVCSMFSILRSSRVYLDEFLLFFFLLAAFVFTYVCVPQSAMYIRAGFTNYESNPLYILFLYSMPAYTIIRHLRNYSYLEKYLPIFSYAVVILTVFVHFFVQDSFANQYMTMSYNMLLQVVVLMLHKPRKGKIFHYLLIAAGIYVIVIGGARGALLGLLIAIAMMVFISNYSQRRKIFIYTLLFAGLLFVLLFYDDIIRSIQAMIQASGSESRTLQLLFMENSESKFDSGRGSLQKKLAETFTLTGNGLFADRLILNGSYAHNLFYELIADYGYLFGGLLSVGVLGLVLYAVFKPQHKEWRYVMLLIPNGFVAMMLSSSYLMVSPCFFALLGICVKIFKEMHNTHFVSKAHLASKR